LAELRNARDVLPELLDIFRTHLVELRCSACGILNAFAVADSVNCAPMLEAGIMRLFVQLYMDAGDLYDADPTWVAPAWLLARKLVASNPLVAARDLEREILSSNPDRTFAALVLTQVYSCGLGRPVSHSLHSCITFCSPWGHTGLSVLGFLPCCVLF
jgi:hypothetical protein